MNDKLKLQLTKYKNAIVPQIEDAAVAERSDDKSPLASTLAVKHIINPGEDKLQEVSYLSIGTTHPLIMLQAFEKHMNNLLVQIKERRYWYLSRYIRRLKAARQWTEEIEQDAIQQVKDAVEELDKIDLRELFIHHLRQSIYQHSRGKDGKFVESLTILSDTEMQTRSAESDEGYHQRIRDQ